MLTWSASTIYVNMNMPLSSMLTRSASIYVLTARKVYFILPQVPHLKLPKFVSWQLRHTFRTFRGNASTLFVSGLGGQDAAHLLSKCHALKNSIQTWDAFSLQKKLSTTMLSMYRVFDNTNFSIIQSSFTSIF